MTRSHQLAALLLLFACVALGCVQRGDRAPTTRARLPLGVPAEGAYLESVLLERPFADAFLNHELWVAASPVGFAETKALHVENGLRVAVIGGALPPRFQALLESDSETVNPHGLTFATRKEAVLPTNGPHEKCRFAVRTDLAGKPAAVEFAQARCGIRVRPELLADGRLKVVCEPVVQHGDRRELIRPTQDGTQFVKQDEVPTESFPALAFETVLGTNDYLMIGWSATEANTLGEAFFGVEANGQPRQRVLVVRGWRLGEALTRDLPPLGGTRPGGKPDGKRGSIAAELSLRPR